MNEPFYSDVLPGGSHWSLRMRRGTVLRLIDESGGANVGMLFYNPENLLERYNAPDTLKCQHTFRLHAGHCLYSDMGRVFCSIIEDSLGWHDTVCGNLTADGLARKWTPRSYQEARNEWTLNGYDSFLVELAKYGLGRKDMAANLNLFSKVSVDAEGNLAWQPGHSRAGDHVSLRFEMDTLVLLHTCPHPLDSSPEYPRRPVRFELHEAAPVGEDDFCRRSRPENERGFRNNALYHFGCTHATGGAQHDR